MRYNKPRKYEVVETYGTLKREVTSSYGHQFYIDQLNAEVLIQDNYDFRPHEGKIVKVTIMIEDKEEE